MTQKLERNKGSELIKLYLGLFKIFVVDWPWSKISCSPEQLTRHHVVDCTVTVHEKVGFGSWRFMSKPV
jgi:hypothetical protein